jgi:hypothetical protein
VREKIICPDCKALVDNIQGEVHPYFGANAGCWKLFGEILAREYGSLAYMKVHRLTVDAYAAQHPGRNEPRAAQSVNVHLMALYLILEKHMPFDFVTKALGKVVEKKKHNFTWLVPPSSLGAMTILDVAAANTPDQHAQLVWDWATSVWKAWEPRRKTIEELALSLS